MAEGNPAVFAVIFNVRAGQRTARCRFWKALMIRPNLDACIEETAKRP